jgi:hypothetical protein
VCIDLQAEGVAKSLRSQANCRFGAKPLIAARDLLSDHAFDSLTRRASGLPN